MTDEQKMDELMRAAGFPVPNEEEDLASFVAAWNRCRVHGEELTLEKLEELGGMDWGWGPREMDELL